MGGVFCFRQVDLALDDVVKSDKGGRGGRGGGRGGGAIRGRGAANRGQCICVLVHIFSLC